MPFSRCAQNVQNTNECHPRVPPRQSFFCSRKSSCVSGRSFDYSRMQSHRKLSLEYDVVDMVRSAESPPDQKMRVFNSMEHLVILQKTKCIDTTEHPSQQISRIELFKSSKNGFAFEIRMEGGRVVRRGPIRWPGIDRRTNQLPGPQ